ncbi:MAG: hypothetical protein KDE08_09815, partial [Rhodobacteraceae bacterium]|nr:hypothetical protein [Paracoccaceae bacterium]
MARLPFTKTKAVPDGAPPDGASDGSAPGPAAAATAPGVPATATSAGGGLLGGMSGMSIRSPWWLRLLIILFIALAVSVIWFTNGFLGDRFSETTRNRADVRLALYTGHILSELQRTSIVPLLLTRDPDLMNSLKTHDFSTTSQRLISAQAEIGAASILLLDDIGRTVAATDRTQIDTKHGSEQYFVNAQRSKDTVFTLSEKPTGGYQFTYSRALLSDGKLAGVIVVGAELAKFERVWAGITEVVAVTDSENRVILSTEPRWRGLPLNEALATRSVPSAFERAFRLTSDWANEPPDAYLRGEAVMRNEARIPFHGWRLTSFTSYDSIREKVNTVLALEIMGFAVLLAMIFYLLSRRARRQTAVFRRESAELRQLNIRLQREIAEREKVQKDLAVAEQTLAQSSKLAALGEMSAAVSHELNQPLAAM